MRHLGDVVLHNLPLLVAAGIVCHKIVSSLLCNERKGLRYSGADVPVLPEDIVTHILSYIDRGEDLSACSRVCRQWHRLALDNGHWARVFWKRGNAEGRFEAEEEAVMAAPRGYWRDMYARFLREPPSVRPSRSHPEWHLISQVVTRWAQRALLADSCTIPFTFTRGEAFDERLRALRTRTFFGADDHRVSLFAESGRALPRTVHSGRRFFSDLVSVFHIVNPDGSYVEFRCACDWHHLDRIAAEQENHGPFYLPPDQITDGISIHAIVYEVGPRVTCRQKEAPRRAEVSDSEDDDLHELSWKLTTALGTGARPARETARRSLSVSEGPGRGAEWEWDPSRTGRVAPGVESRVFQLCGWSDAGPGSGSTAGDFVVNINRKATVGVDVYVDQVEPVLDVLGLTADVPARWSRERLAVEFFRYVLACLSCSRALRLIDNGQDAGSWAVRLRTSEVSEAEHRIRITDVEHLRRLIRAITKAQTSLWRNHIWQI